MKTNQEFIESYLVGLNHEFARELLWNEYPTDMQGSYFRQFWDVSSVPNVDDKDAKQFAEDLKDIPRIHQWDKISELGSHNQRDAQGDKTQVSAHDRLCPAGAVVRGPAAQEPAAPER